MTVFLLCTHFPIAIPNLITDKRSPNLMSCEFSRTNFPMSSLPIDQHLFAVLLEDTLCSFPAVIASHLPGFSGRFLLERPCCLTCLAVGSHCNSTAKQMKYRKVETLRNLQTQTCVQRDNVGPYLLFQCDARLSKTPYLSLNLSPDSMSTVSSSMRARHVSSRIWTCFEALSMKSCQDQHQHPF